jgi:DNA-binding NarL/FixJ family response regulator
VAILGGAGVFASEALAWMLVESGSRVIGSYPDLRALQADLSAGVTEAQVALIDAEDTASGIAALVEVRRARPELKLMLLCDALTPAIVRCAIEERVEGVVLKSDSPDEVILALHHVLEGRAVMPSGWQAVPIDPEGGAPIESLSAREREVLELATGGMRNREIAERLMISSNTVKFHLRTIYSRLGVANRVQAACVLKPLQDGRPEEGNRAPGSNMLDDGDEVS